MTVIEGDGGCLVIDAGLAFPRDEHLGVDLVLPDISYLADRGRPIDAVVLTHAHEDHVGGLPYLLREVDVPRIIGTRLTLGLVQSKLAEHKLTDRTELVEVRPEDGPVEEGPFRLELVRMAHSIPGQRRRRRGGGRTAHPPHVGLQARPHAGGRLQDRRRPSRRARQPRRRSPARRLDERRAARLHGLGEARRRGVPADHPLAQGADTRRVVRLERPPHAAGGRRRPRVRPQGVRRRTVDAEEPQHRARARLHGSARRCAREARRARQLSRRTRCSFSVRAARESRCPR